MSCGLALLREEIDRYKIQITIELEEGPEDVDVFKEAVQDMLHYSSDSVLLFKIGEGVPHIVTGLVCWVLTGSIHPPAAFGFWVPHRMAYQIAWARRQSSYKVDQFVKLSTNNQNQ